MRSGWDFVMSFTITTMGRWQSGSSRKDRGPASIVPADLMCWERTQGTDTRPQSGIFEKKKKKRLAGVDEA